MLFGLTGCATIQPHIDSILSRQDRKLLVEATQKALENNKTGQSTNWSNPATKIHGTVTPVETYQTKTGLSCRDYQVIVAVNGQTHQVTDTACRQPNGAWKSVNHPGLAGAHVFQGLDYRYYNGKYYYFPYPPPYYDPYYNRPYWYPRWRFWYGDRDFD